MTEKIAIRADAALLSKAKRIFGDDLITGAWVTTWDYDKPGEIAERLTAAAFVDDGENELRYDAQTIILEFSNGVRVEFENSEWASMSRFTEESYIA